MRYDKHLHGRQFLQSPAAELLKKPHLIFVFSAPAAVFAGILLFFSAHIPLRFVLPSVFLVCFAPYAVLSLIQRKNARRRKRSFHRFAVSSHLPQTADFHCQNALPQQQRKTAAF
ncbi:MAG TPA: hypothetical protein O0Y08_00865 [Methanocorpusculum sp.]|nr:hypothetical protein [Methanocorpusculum sp.]HJJ59400.1 hypothetical protein [Methanocorpusculum sp.]